MEPIIDITQDIIRENGSNYLNSSTSKRTSVNNVNLSPNRPRSRRLVPNNKTEKGGFELSNSIEISPPPLTRAPSSFMLTKEKTKYDAPEAEVDFANDVFSFGIIFYEVVHRTPIFCDLEIMDILEIFESNQTRPPLPYFFDVPAVKTPLVSLLWNTDPTARPNFKTLNKFFIDMNSEMVNLEHRLWLNKKEQDWEAVKQEMGNIFNREKEDFEVLSRFLANEKSNSPKGEKEELKQSSGTASSGRVCKLKKFLKFFKPFRPVIKVELNQGRGAPRQSEGMPMHNILEIAAQQCYLDEVSQETAHHLLQTQAPGTYFLARSPPDKDINLYVSAPVKLLENQLNPPSAQQRDSAEKPSDDTTIALKVPIRFQRMHVVFLVGNRSFFRLQDILTHFTENALPSTGLKLTKPL